MDYFIICATGRVPHHANCFKSNVMLMIPSDNFLACYWALKIHLIRQTQQRIANNILYTLNHVLDTSFRLNTRSNMPTHIDLAHKKRNSETTITMDVESTGKNTELVAGIYHCGFHTKKLFYLAHWCGLLIPLSTSILNSWKWGHIHVPC